MDKFKIIKEYSNFIDLYKLPLLLKYWIKIINHKGKTVTNYPMYISSRIMTKGVTNIKRLTFLLTILMGGLPPWPLQERSLVCFVKKKGE